MIRTQAAAILLALAGLAGAPALEDRILWHFDADQALRAARESGRPIVLLKVRADIGKDVKT